MLLLGVWLFGRCNSPISRPKRILLGFCEAESRNSPGFRRSLVGLFVSVAKNDYLLWHVMSA